MKIDRTALSMGVFTLALLVQGQAQIRAGKAGPLNSVKTLPVVVRKSIIEDNATCTEMGGTPGNLSRLVLSTDLNGDGIPDFIKDLGNYDCRGAASAMAAGQSGSALTIFVGVLGGAAVEAFHGVVQGARLLGPPGKQRLYVGVMGPDCGQKDAAKKAMVDVEVCLMPLNWNADRKTFVLGPLNDKRPFTIQ